MRHFCFGKHFWAGMVIATMTLVALTLSTAATCQASILFVTVAEVGNDVVFTMTGTIDLTGLTPGSDSSHTAGIDPAGGSVSMGAGTTDSYTGFFAVPGSFGTGGFVAASSYSGDHVAFTQTALYVPDGYVSGSFLNGTITFANSTFASLGLTQNIYAWVWGETEGQNVMALEIFSEVPEPSACVIWLALAVSIAAGRRVNARELKIGPVNRSGSRSQ